MKIARYFSGSALKENIQAKQQVLDLRIFSLKIFLYSNAIKTIFVLFYLKFWVSGWEPVSFLRLGLTF